MAAGVLCSRIVGFESREVWFAAPALFILAGLAKWRGASRLAILTVLIGVFFAGLLLHTSQQPGTPPQLDANSRETVTLTGCVVEPTVFYEDRDQFTLELAPASRAKVNLFVKDGDQPPSLYYGQRVEIDATVRRPVNFKNPGAFDYVRYLAHQHIYWTASGKPANVRVLPGRCGSPFWGAVFALRTAGLQRLDRLYAGNPFAIGMMQGILLGDTTKLEKIWTDDYRRTGTFHALVISGMHVAVIAAVLLFLLRILFVPPILALALTALTAWLYALVSGWSAPVVRSAGGFTLFLIAKYFYRRGRILNLLAAVAIGFLILDPEQLFDPSFQLSFLAVAALGALAAPILERTTGPLAMGLRGLTDTDGDLKVPPGTAQFRIEIRQIVETVSLWTRVPMKWLVPPVALVLRLLLWAWEMALISGVIQVGLALPMAVYFHRISFSGLTANLAVVPLLNSVVPIGFLAIFTGWHWPAALANALLDWSRIVVEAHARWEPNWRVPGPPLWLSLGFVAALLFFGIALHLTRVWRWLAAVVVLALFGIILWHPFPPQIERGSLEFTAIDVGQGDSFLLVFPNGTTMLVDGGGIPVFGNKKRKPRMDIGEDVVAPYLWSRSLRRIDIIVGTHMHADHAGGLPALIEDFRPSELWISGREENAEWRAIEAKAKVAGTRIIEMRVGGGGSYGGAEVEVLSPGADFVPGIAQNNDSLVLRVSYRQHSLLLMGDADRRVEASIPLARVDVLKVGHHGSKNATSLAFLKAVRPSWAVIPAGEGNIYRFPHPDTLERLSQFGVAVFRTDVDGLVTLRTDGRRFTTMTQKDMKGVASFAALR